jgi:hypothetical protein
MFGNDWLNGRNVYNLTAANKLSLVEAKIFTAASAIFGGVLLNRIRGAEHFQGCTFMTGLASGLFTRWSKQALSFF